MNNEAEKTEIPQRLIDLDNYAKTLAKQMYMELLKNLHDDPLKINTLELFAVIIKSTAMFTTSIVYSLYKDMVTNNSEFGTLYDQEKVETEISNAIKFYANEYRKDLSS